MADIKIVTDSSSDLSQAYYDEHAIDMVPFFVTFDKQTYYKERVEISVDNFYKKLRNEEVYPATSMPLAAQYADVFRSALENGQDVICLCLTAKFSGSYVSAITARDELAAEFPQRRIAVIDSIQASCGQGLVLNEIVRMRGRGVPFDDIVAAAEACKHTARVFLTVDSLDYLTKGGRVGKVSALAGSLLNIKPIIVMQNAELIPVAKVRGRQKSVQRVIDLTAAYIGGEKDKFDLVPLHADCYAEAADLGAWFIKEGYTLPLGVQHTGVTIGAHTGPTLVGMAMIKRCE